MSDSYTSVSEDEEDDVDELQMQLDKLEEEVRTLRSRKNELEQLLQKAVKFKSVPQNEPSSRTDVQEHLQELENEALLRKLMLYKLSGVAVVVKEGRDVVVEFTASVHGHYFEPSYVRFKRIPKGDWTLVNYFVPVSVNIRDMAKTSPMKNDRDFVTFVRSVQLCIEAYYDRKEQIMSAKEIAKSKRIKVFNSIDYLYVTFTLRMADVETSEEIPVTICLLYDPSGVRPSSMKAQNRGLDRETLNSVLEEFKIIKEKSLDVSFNILFCKEEENKKDTSLDENLALMEEMDLEDEVLPSNTRMERRVADKLNSKRISDKKAKEDANLISKQRSRGPKRDESFSLEASDLSSEISEESPERDVNLNFRRKSSRIRKSRGSLSHDNIGRKVTGSSVKRGGTARRSRAFKNRR